MNLQKLQGYGSINPFGGSRGITQGGGQPEARIGAAGQDRNKLDPAMLGQKRENFLNGLGGTNNPDDHKIFFAA